jgi:hypothetical protein
VGALCSVHPGGRGGGATDLWVDFSILDACSLNTTIMLYLSRNKFGGSTAASHVGLKYPNVVS